MRVVGVHPIVADEPVHLVELAIEGSAEGFDFGDITQEVPGQPLSNWQAVYDEREVGHSSSTTWTRRNCSSAPLVYSPCRRNHRSRSICGALSMNHRSARVLQALAAAGGCPPAAGNQAAGGLPGKSWSGYNEIAKVSRQKGGELCLIRHGAKHDWYRNPNTGVRSLFRVIERSRRTLPGTLSECSAPMMSKATDERT